MHNSRLARIVRKPVSTGAIVLALVSVTTQMVALAAATGWSPSARGDVKATMTASVIHSLQCGGSAATKPSACPTAQAQTKLAGDNTHQRVVVPRGGTQCPDSEPGSSCANHAASVDKGNSAVPDGQPACPVDPSKSLGAPGSCIPGSPVVAPAAPVAPVAPSQPAVPPPATPSPTHGAQPSPDDNGSASSALTLTASSGALTAGEAMLLDARSTLDVSGTPYAIEIFDASTQTLVAACTETSECQVSFSAKSGLHQFVAFVTQPTTTLPTAGAKLTSNKVDVRFLGVSLRVNDPSVVGPGKAVTFTADATEDVGKTGFVIELHDAITGERLTFCSRGTTCSMSLIEPVGGVHTIIATLGPSTPEVRDANPAVHAASTRVQATWLAISATVAATRSGTATLSATANADLHQTPYLIYFFDQSQKQVGDACNAQSCTTVTSLPAGSTQTFIAVIAPLPLSGSVRGPLANVASHAPVALSRLDVQAVSAPAKPVRLLWGVDSCEHLTDLFGQVNSVLGTPDFWGRYLPNTGNCGGLNGDEIALAHARHMGILPIYNDYDCSAVVGYAAGSAYAAEAVRWLQNDMIPQGTVIAVDIEPPGPACPGAAGVDTSFIQGWYDGIAGAGYSPGYYGNTSPNSEFANAWCTTTQQRPDIAANSYLWSFEPSLIGNYSRSNAPAFGSYSTTCPGHYAAWQYMISSGSTPNVDQDDAGSDLPLWYP